MKKSNSIFNFPSLLTHFFLAIYPSVCMGAANDFRKFEIIVPDTVEQGTMFEADYHLVANNYRDWDYGKIKSLRFVSNKFVEDVVSISGSKYYSTYNRMQFQALGTGAFILPQLEVTVSGKKYKSPQKSVFVKPNRAYGAEYLIAKEWFKGFSYDIDTCSFDVIKHDEQLIVFSDQRNKLSIAIAKRAKQMNITPVVYWSTESDILPGDNNAQLNFLSYYSGQLYRLYDKIDALDFQVNSKKKKNNIIEPLLGGIVYGPEEPYNKYQPTVMNVKSQVGSIPTLLTQIFAYYKYPAIGNGKFTHYRTIHGRKHVIVDDYSNVRIDWEKDFCEDYRNCKDTLKINKISELAAALSSSISTSYNLHGSTFYDSDIKMSLVNFWNYSPSMRSCTTTNLDTICGLIYNEIDNKRIPVVSYKSNFFVCDGYCGDYLHINMGLYGGGNGYYRVPFSSDSQVKYPIDKLIVGIEPDTKENLSKVVSTKKPNTLRIILTKDECQNLRQLNISGPLGNDDIKLLRQMLGAPAEDCFEWCGKLKKLDLSQAKLKSDKKGYFFKYKLSGHAGSSWTQYSNNFGQSWTENYHSYNYNRMSKSDWESFKDADMDRRDGSIVKYENGICTLYCYVKSGIISDAMFFSCDNLQQIQLPKNTKKIMANSFNECSSLRTIQLPSSVTECQKYAFSNNVLLENVLLNRTQRISFDFDYLKNSARSNPDFRLVQIENF